MRKLLLALFAAALLAAFTAPSYAADFKFSGFFRVRGITSDNMDRSDDAHDGIQGYDALTRPRFTAKTAGGKIWAMWEIDWYERSVSGQTVGPQTVSPQTVTIDGKEYDVSTGRVSTGRVSSVVQNANANQVVGRTAGRVGVGTNRWVVDFAIPGSQLRFRWGRTDYVSPDKEIYDSSGRSREPGFGLYGKLSNTVSLSMFTTKTGESGSGTRIGVEASDKDDYYVGLSFKASPKLTLTPWIANSRAGGSYDYWYGALHAKAKMGVMSLNATGVYQGGEVSETVDLTGWGVLLRTSFAMGKLKLLANLTMLSGDKDGDADGDRERFEFPQLGGSGWVNGGTLMTQRSLLGGITGMQSRLTNNSVSRVQLVGGNNRQLNGAFVFDVGANYQVSKAFSTFAGVYFYNAAEPAVGDQYDDAKDYGTEFNTGFKWKLYPKLELRTVAAYLIAGDYGKKKDDKDFDDSWNALWSLRHFF